MLYRSILARVRWQQAELELPYRCDSPDRRRRMLIRLKPLPSSHIEFSSSVLHEEKRPRVDLLDPRVERSDAMLRMCSWCNRAHAGGWVDVEEAVRVPGLFERAALPRLTHGLCDACLIEVREAAVLKRAG
jgi:hypothetical protein